MVSQSHTENAQRDTERNSTALGVYKPSARSVFLKKILLDTC